MNAMRRNQPRAVSGPVGRCALSRAISTWKPANVVFGAGSDGDNMEENVQTTLDCLVRAKPQGLSKSEAAAITLMSGCVRPAPCTNDRNKVSE